MPGPVQQEMERLRTDAFSPTSLQVINDSAKHSGHSGDDGSGESHFTVVIEAPAFADTSRLETSAQFGPGLRAPSSSKLSNLNMCSARSPRPSATPAC